MLDNILAQAENLNTQIAALSSGKEREEFLENPESINQAFSILLNLITKEWILIQDAEILWELKHLSERNALFFLLSFLYAKWFFDDSKECEDIVFHILSDFFKYTDASKIGTLEQQHEMFIEKVGIRKALPYYPKINQELDTNIQKVLDILHKPQEIRTSEENTFLDVFIYFLHKEWEISESDLINAISSDNIEVAIHEILMKRISWLQKRISQIIFRNLSEWDYDFIPGLSWDVKNKLLSNPNLLLDIIDNDTLIFEKFFKLCWHITRKIQMWVSIRKIQGEDWDFFRGEKYIEKMIDILYRLKIITPEEKEEIEILSFEESALKLLQHIILKDVLGEDITFLRDVQEVYDNLALAIWVQDTDTSKYTDAQVKDLLEWVRGEDINDNLEHDQIESFLSELLTYITYNNSIFDSDQKEFIAEFITFLQEIEDEDSIGRDDFWVNIHDLHEALWKELYEFVAHEIVFYIMLNYLDDNFPLMQQAYKALLEYYMKYKDTEKIEELRDIIHPYKVLNSTQ